ncbi:TATD1-like protein [Mya arenaria]|uniref:Deoxyribonuclease TATDN1 n=1 Tax=Mya arenaria TaxID=6604 RepID=A0ABY7FQ36_MYAAR|nr:TATD1-like protein [Mya arenaria]
MAAPMRRYDFLDVLKRASDVGVEKIMVTAGCMEDVKEATELVKSHDHLYTTIGCHPTRCSEFEKSGDPDGYMNQLLDIAAQNKGKVVAVGEFGLDYDRLQFCPKQTQLKYFEKQFELVEQLQLPLFLHSRNAASDFSDIIRRHRDKFRGGVFPSKKKEKWEKGNFVKSRNEPATIIQVLEVLAGARNENIEDLARVIHDNTQKLFFPSFC